MINSILHNKKDKDIINNEAQILKNKGGQVCLMENNSKII